METLRIAFARKGGEYGECGEHGREERKVLSGRDLLIAF
jgi:hypothetical protein